MATTISGSNPIAVLCYLINLDRSPKRLEHFQTQANAMAIDFVRISAVDGNELNGKVMERLISMRSGKVPLGPGEMGCFLSHRKVWAQILEDGVDWGFVVEDDIHFCNASQFLINPDWLPQQIDIIKAETVRQRIQLDTTIHLKPFGHELRQLHSNHGGAAAYFISRSAAQFLLNETASTCDPVDLILFHQDFGFAKSLRILQLDPAICIQDHLLGGVGRLDSLLDGDRTQSRLEQGVPGKPIGFSKVLREVTRPFSRTSKRLNEWIKSGLGAAVFKKVSFAGDK